ncbi:MAG: quinolinate synthase NadA [Victivallales bacterium]|nr:quinolinate synthase NadA [Victivallales bacterium]
MGVNDIVSEINRLRAEKKAVILAHTYQPAEVQEVADFVGDSYGLSVKATQVHEAELIVFCGVRFMAETAAILNPGKKVVMPDASAGCPMADMISGEQLRQFKAQHPGAPVVCYVNSTAEVKAESTICCTSSNAVKIVSSLGDVPEILFVPDRNLGQFVEKQLGRKLVLWNGFCPIHNAFTLEALREAKVAHPNAKSMVHPETRQELQAEADYILATGQMLDLVKKARQGEYIVGTECGINAPLREAAPNARFFDVNPPLVCKDMKKTSLEGILRSLQTGETPIAVPEDIAKKALASIQAMLAVK